jgi:mRNA-degrading endonuclease RelE of RelBE toxin-antitoxin system
MDKKILSQLEQVIERAEQPVKKRSAKDFVGVWKRRCGSYREGN